MFSHRSRRPMIDGVGTAHVLPGEVCPESPRPPAIPHGSCERFPAGTFGSPIALTQGLTYGFETQEIAHEIDRVHARRRALGRCRIRSTRANLLAASSEYFPSGEHVHATNTVVNWTVGRR